MTTGTMASKGAASKVLGGYLVFATALALWSMMHGRGGLAAVSTYLVLGVILAVANRLSGEIARAVRDWFPLLALPALYLAIPRTAVDAGPFDGIVQQWDRALFRTDPARTFAGGIPWWPLSELLHASYLSYYAIIYVPPFLMYSRGDRLAFARTVSAFTIAMVACFVIFCLFPVEGPRYAWPRPVGVPGGIVRDLVMSVLERGSSRGTAFPSSHEAIAMVMSVACLAWDRRIGLPVLALSLLLGVGAVYGGFHYGVDMLAGAVLGMLAWYGSGKRRSRSPKPLWIKDVDEA